MTKDNQRIQNRAIKERKITNSTDMSWVDVTNVHVPCTKQHSWHQCFKWKWNAPSSVCWHALWGGRTANVGSKQAPFAPKADITHLLPLLNPLISFFLVLGQWARSFATYLGFSVLGSVRGEKKKPQKNNNDFKIVLVRPPSPNLLFRIQLLSILFKSCISLHFSRNEHHIKISVYRSSN